MPEVESAETSAGRWRVWDIDRSGTRNAHVSTDGVCPVGRLSHLDEKSATRGSVTELALRCAHPLVRAFGVPCRHRMLADWKTSNGR